jgi:hypothetical protein
MPILGTIASQVPANLPADSFYSIATATVGSGGSASISFSSIPSTYKHLQIRGIGRATSGQSATALADVNLTFNGDTNSNYARHRMLGETSISTAGLASQQQIPFSSVLPRSSSASNTFGSFVLDILDYSSTNKRKTVRWLGGGDLNGAGTITFQSAFWMNNSAISSMTFIFETDSSGVPCAQYSRIALYGIKG